MDTTETASPVRLVLRLCALVLFCLLIVGPARADPEPAEASCTEGTIDQPLSSEDPAVAQCVTLQMGLSASPNPTPAGGTVSFSWSVSPETDCWDNLGHSAWGGYSFSMTVSEPFTWIVYCTGNGVESATLYVGVQDTPPPPPPPPPPPSGGHDPKGRLDSVQTSGVATGWACDPDSYAAAIESRFYVDGPPGTGAFLGSATAGLTREAAVGDACGGTRNHGFEFTLPASVRDGATHSLYAYAVNVGDGSNAQLAGSPMSFQITAPPPPPSCSGIVVLYELPNYAGRCWSFDAGIYPTLSSADNIVSSIRVQDGYYATLFADQGYGGAQWTTVTSADSAGWVDVGRGASSLIVQAPEVLADASTSGASSATASQSFAAAAGSGCWRVSDSLSRYSVNRRRAFTYTLATDFCTNGKTITRLENRDIVVDIPPFPFPLNLVNSWRYAQSVYLPGEKGARSTTLKVQGEFSFCLFHYGCPLSYNQWIKIELSGDGSATCTNSSYQLPHNCTRSSTRA